MKNRFIIATIVFTLFCSSLSSQKINLTKVGEWGNPDYIDIFVQGNYAYIINKTGLSIVDVRNHSSLPTVGTYAGDFKNIYVDKTQAFVLSKKNGLYIIDVSNPVQPILKGTYQSWHSIGWYAEVVAANGYAYLLVGNSLGAGDDYGSMHIIDVTSPASPQLVGQQWIKYGYYYSSINIQGNYAFLTSQSCQPGGCHTGLDIIDISDPSSPQLESRLSSFYIEHHLDSYVDGTYFYMSFTDGGIKVFDISDVQAPVQVGTVSLAQYPMEIFVNNNLIYVADLDEGLKIIDISNLNSPVLKSTFDTQGDANMVDVRNGYVFLGIKGYGMQIINVTDPSSPSLSGETNDSNSYLGAIDVQNRYAYVGSHAGGLKIINISNLSQPVMQGVYNVYPYSGGLNVYGVCVKDGYAFFVDDYEGLGIVDISKPASPFLKSYFSIGAGSGNQLYIKDNIAFALHDFGLDIIDVSDPNNPTFRGYLSPFGGPFEYGTGIFVNDNFAYMTDSYGGFAIINVSDLTAPKIESISSVSHPTGVYIKDKYAYVTDEKVGLNIFDVSNSSSPQLMSQYDTGGDAQDIDIQDNYAFIANGDSGIKIIDITYPASPILVGSQLTYGDAKALKVKNKQVYVVDGEYGKFLIYQMSIAPEIDLNRTNFYFAATPSGMSTKSQTLLINNAGEEDLNWVASSDKDWIKFSPSSGTNSGVIPISVDAAGLAIGDYTGVISLIDINASNSPQQVSISLRVYGESQTAPPFGLFSTPVENTTLSGSIPVTGWVLDDIGVECVKIFRDPLPDEGKSLVYIGDAVFVAGARPDVEVAYPGYPMNYQAGWGYMMLTNFLPNNSNGQFTIYTSVTDVEGNQILLGKKRIIVDNANAVKPFGAIDTPTQGGAASGKAFINWGWALTPQPNTIPTDGSTINVWVDGVHIGNPSFNHYRKDIANLFPGYNNSNGAVGYIELDTTQYMNGIHTIAWSAMDDAGNIDGIGSRYFNIINSGTVQSSPMKMAISYKIPGKTLEYIRDLPPGDIDYIYTRQGFGSENIGQNINKDRDGMFCLEGRETERVEIQFSKNISLISGFIHAGNKLLPLPQGSHLDTTAGNFSWIPGHAYNGKYSFIFVMKNQQGKLERINVIMNIRPKFFPKDAKYIP